MGLSRNKVAVSEGAAGSPPFYGEHERLKQITRMTHKENNSTRQKLLSIFVVRFPGTVETVTGKTKREKTSSHLPITSRYGGVAQLGEHLPCKQGVKGSIPFISTTVTKVTEKNVH